MAALVLDDEEGGEGDGAGPGASGADRVSPSAA